LLDEVRIPVWQSAIEMIADHPWQGVGLDGFRFVYPRYIRPEAWTEPTMYHPHNVWLDAAVRLGIPGLIAYATLVGLCLYGVVRALSAANIRRGPIALRRALYLGLLASLVAALAHGMVDSGFFLADLAWSMALVAGIVGQSWAVGVAGDVQA
jgi:O-antigen ligase